MANAVLRTAVICGLCGGLAVLAPASRADEQASDAVEVSSAATVLTLRQALELARTRNRQLENATLAVDIANDQIGVARSHRYPQLSVYGSGGYLLSSMDFRFRQGAFGVYEGLGPVPARDTTIESSRRSLFIGLAQLSQPLSQHYKISLITRQAEVGRRADEAKLQSQRHAIFLRVKRAYYGIVQAQSALDASTATLGFARELERITTEAVAAKTALKGDVLEVQAKVAEAEFEDRRIADSLLSQKEQLNALLGRDLATAFSVELETPLETEMDLAAARERALVHRPELHQAKLGIEHAELSRREKRAGYIPDVSLALSHARTSTTDVLPAQVTTAGVIAHWDVFDGGRRRHEVAAATKKVRQARNTAADAEAEVLVEVGVKFRQLQQSRLALRAAGLHLAAEREKLRVALDSFKQDFALRKDLLQQQAATETANSRHQQALLGFLTAQAEFENALGNE